MKITQIKKQFKPKLSYGELEYLAGERRLNGKEIKNSVVYSLVRELTDLAFPSREDKLDKWWHHFYLPLKRSGRLICLPLGMMEYQREFFIGFQGLGNLHIKKGKERVEKEYQTIFKEVLRFVPLIKKSGNEILEKTVPYDIRTGKILGKHVLRKLMAKKEKKKILQDYQKHLERKLAVTGISLDDYLETAALCYQAAYGEKTKGLSPRKMYQKWADGRDCGMLEIKDGNSKRSYAYWLRHKSHCGGHPFEIVFSWHGHGIHLYPPSSDQPCYSLYVTNYAYAGDYLNMFKALLKEGVPFQSRELEEVVQYFSGETYFSVNEYDEHMIHYFHSREDKKLYFKHIEWDKLKIPKWRR